MTNRLPYETSGGALSSSATFKQLLEQLRLAEESARQLSNLCKARNDTTNSQRWSLIANNFSKVRDVVTALAHGKSSSTLGYTGNA